jgi:hypothetical protein
VKVYGWKSTFDHGGLTAGVSGSTLWLSHDGHFPPLSWSVWASVVQPNDPALARLHSSLSVNLDLMIVQDALRTRLALLQRVVPFDVAGVRQLLAAAIR